jgi:SHS family lactate transporter-like MFS transporter
VPTVEEEKAAERANQRNALLAGFLGWALDAFDFFILTFVMAPVAKDFNCSIPQIALTLTASQSMRFVGAAIFGVLADRFGRRIPLILDILFYSVIEVLSGFAPNYRTFLILRLLYGIGMGGEWGVGASLVMESVSPKWRGLLSGLLQEGYSLGFLLAGVAYFVIFPHWGWRAMFFIGGLPALLSLFIFAKVKETEAWQESRTDWRTYWRLAFKNWRRFLFLVLLMTMMMFTSHGTQDMYPTFLQRQRHFSPHATAVITIIMNLGAICGGLALGLFSDRLGRRRGMVTALLLAALLIPLWVFAPYTPLIVLGAFLMQFMVQGAWGIIPAHINELSPNELRGFFPGLTYQLGALFASTTGYIEAKFGEHFSYSQSMGFFAATVLLLGSLVIWLGPEATGISFRRKAPS